MVATDSIPKSLRIYCDNSTTIFFSKIDKYLKGVKHMDLNIGANLVIANRLTKRFTTQDIH
ncbi:hypothetical protein CR513_55529, partial [Mucuna pruriens]